MMVACDTALIYKHSSKISHRCGCNSRNVDPVIAPISLHLAPAFRKPSTQAVQERQPVSEESANCNSQLANVLESDASKLAYNDRRSVQPQVPSPGYTVAPARNDLPPVIAQPAAVPRARRKSRRSKEALPQQVARQPQVAWLSHQQHTGTLLGDKQPQHIQLHQPWTLPSAQPRQSPRRQSVQQDVVVQLQHNKLQQQMQHNSGKVRRRRGRQQLFQQSSSHFWDEIERSGLEVVERKTFPGAEPAPPPIAPEDTFQLLQVLQQMPQPRRRLVIFKAGGYIYSEMEALIEQSGLNHVMRMTNLVRKCHCVLAKAKWDTGRGVNLKQHQAAARNMQVPFLLIQRLDVLELLQLLRPVLVKKGIVVDAAVVMP